VCDSAATRPSPQITLGRLVIILRLAMWFYRKKCLDAANTLRDLLPELFDCSCAMKRPDTRQRCDRIQWRLANNTCLGERLEYHQPLTNHVVLSHQYISEVRLRNQTLQDCIFIYKRSALLSDYFLVAFGASNLSCRRTHCRFISNCCGAPR